MAATIDQLQKIVTRNRVVAIVLDFSTVISVDYTGARVSLFDLKWVFVLIHSI